MIMKTYSSADIYTGRKAFAGAYSAENIKSLCRSPSTYYSNSLIVAASCSVLTVLSVRCGVRVCEIPLQGQSLLLLLSSGVMIPVLLASLAGS
jgi:hypothetical protein